MRAGVVTTLTSALALFTAAPAALGAVLALFVTLPYGKFVHGFYRIAALWVYERRT